MFNLLKLFMSYGCNAQIIYILYSIFTSALHIYYLKPELGNAGGISRQALGLQCGYIGLQSKYLYTLQFKNLKKTHKAVTLTNKYKQMSYN